jgi:hypothetical protein
LCRGWSSRSGGRGIWRGRRSWLSHSGGRVTWRTLLSWMKITIKSPLSRAEHKEAFHRVLVYVTLPAQGVSISYHPHFIDLPPQRCFDLMHQCRIRVALVGTHTKRAIDAATRSSWDVGTSKHIPTISTKDTNIVSLCTMAGCAGFQGKPIAAHPRGTNEKVFPRSHASALLGRCK